MEDTWSLVTLPSYRTKPGPLCVAEIVKIAPGFFPGDAAPRVYWVVNDTPERVVRGGHSHPPGGKREIMIVPMGKAVIHLHSPGRCGAVTLDAPDRALVLPNGIWHLVELEPASMLLAIVSTLFKVDEAVTEMDCGHRYVQR